MGLRKKEQSDEGPPESPPGPPPREKRRLRDYVTGYRPRLAKPIWMTLIGRGGRSWDVWVSDPDSNGKIKVVPPWADKEKPQHFSVGEGEGAYDITLDEDRMVRRVTVYEDMSLAPAYLEKGNWQSVADMAEGVQSFINGVMLERAAEIGETEIGFPPWGYAMLIMAAMTSAVAILSMIL